jgi:hypothetical protein
MMLDRSTLEDQIDAARAKFPLGSQVIYTPVFGWPETEESVVRSAPWALGHGGIVLKIEGRAGGVSIKHLSKLVPPRHPATNIGE